MKKVMIMVMLMTVVMGIVSGCGASDERSSYDTEQNPSYTSAPTAAVNDTDLGAQKNETPPAIPDPARILDQVSVDVERDVDVEMADGTYVFDHYIYDFGTSGNLMDKSDLMAYQMLLSADDLTLERVYNDGMYTEYTVVWGTHLLGFLTTTYGHWELYVPESIGLNSKPNSSSGSNTNTSGGNSFLNDSFNITVKPGAGDYQSSTTAMLCDACNGSGDCDGCNGDGWFDNPYLGSNTGVCNICDVPGECSVCDGTGSWNV